NSLQSNDFTSLDLPDRSFDTGRGQQVQSSDLYRQLTRYIFHVCRATHGIIFSPDPSCIFRRTRELGQFLAGGEPGRVRVPGKLVGVLDGGHVDNLEGETRTGSPKRKQGR